MKKFLIADDDSDDVELFKEALRNADPSIACYAASNGKEVFEKLNSGEFAHPDIIFLDINMPEMDGWDCLAALKKDEAYKLIPVIMYSTSNEQRDVDTALNLGALCFYTKPTSFIQLQIVLSLIASNLEGHLVEAIKSYEGFKLHKMFSCS